MAEATEHTEAWQAKPWKQFQRIVFRLQKRIYRATRRVMTRCMVSVTRTTDLTSRMIQKCHVQFCSGRGWGNPPPDRNQMPPLL
jgi:hypothetical protein